MKIVSKILEYVLGYPVLICLLLIAFVLSSVFTIIYITWKLYTISNKNVNFDVDVIEVFENIFDTICDPLEIVVNATASLFDINKWKKLF